MAFRLFTKNNYEFNLPEELNLHQKTLIKTLKNTSEKLDIQADKSDKNSLFLHVKHPLFRFNYLPEIKVSIANSILIQYHYSKLENISITILLILFGFYISSFHFNSILIITLIISIALFIFNDLYINSLLKKIIFSSVSIFIPVPGYELSLSQKQWIRNETRCSACGAELNPYLKFCQECGFEKEKRKTRKLNSITNTSNDSNTDINYHYK